MWLAKPFHRVRPQDVEAITSESTIARLVLSLDGWPVEDWPEIRTGWHVIPSAPLAGLFLAAWPEWNGPDSEGYFAKGPGEDRKRRATEDEYRAYKAWWEHWNEG